MNGLHGMPQFANGGPGPMGMPPNADGMMPGYFGQRGPSAQSNQASPIPGGPRYGHPNQRSGAPTPSNIMGGNFPVPPQGMVNGPPGTQPQMFSEQLRNMQRMNPRMPQGFNLRHMRPFGPNGQNMFIESPSGTPPFPQNQMLPNGMCPVSMMSSPGPGGSGPSQDGSAHDHNRFMMMQSGSFGMQHHDGSGGTPTSCTAGGPTSVPGMSSNGGHPGSNLAPNSVDNNSAGHGQLQSILNGNDNLEMKQSPASNHNNVNGGTPGGTHHGNPGSIQHGNPASCHGDPSSVHSQSGSIAPGSALIGAPHQTPTSESDVGNNIEFQQNINSNDEAQEISKIKASLIDDYTIHHKT